MTILTETDNSIFLTSPAIVLDNNRDTASWASQYVLENKNIKWILGKYVEADNANSNGQFWTYDDLRLSQPSIAHSPMNIDHHMHEIVGTWVASEMIMPTNNDAAMNPYIETLGAFWKWYFPEKMREVQAAYDSGQLFISMECVSDTVTCAGPDGCGQTFEYAGPSSASYCSHIQERSSFRQLNNSAFLGGALIMPGNSPGWKSAEVKEISKYTSDEEKHKMMVAIAKAQPHLSPQDWEKMMWAIQMQTLSSRVKEAAAAPVAEDKRIYFRIVDHYKSCPVDQPYGVIGEKSGVLHGCHADMKSAAAQLRGLYAATDPKNGYKPSPADKKNLETPTQHDKRRAKEKLAESARQFSTKSRDNLASKGYAMPDGSYPIVTVEDLKNAIQAIGRAKDVEAVKSHIKKRAKALNSESLLPKNWR